MQKYYEIDDFLQIEVIMRSDIEVILKEREMRCNKECGYRTPYGYCGVTTCCNLVTTTAQPSHFSEVKKMREECDFCLDHEKEDTLYERIDDMTRDIIYRPIDIQYCPICGKKLRGEEDE